MRINQDATVSSWLVEQWFEDYKFFKSIIYYPKGDDKNEMTYANTNDIEHNGN